MKLLKRNTRTVYYCNYAGKTYEVDADGYKTGEFKKTYTEPKELVCNVSPASGLVVSEIFGNVDGYNRVIVTDDMDATIDENTVVCVDVSPEYDNGDVNFDYLVKRVARSLNSVSILLAKVDVQ